MMSKKFGQTTSSEPKKLSQLEYNICDLNTYIDALEETCLAYANKLRQLRTNGDADENETEAFTSYGSSDISNRLDEIRGKLYTLNNKFKNLLNATEL